MSNIGRTLYGSCDGRFSFMGEQRVEAEGWDWVVVRRCDTLGPYPPDFIEFDNDKDKQKLLDKWAKSPTDQE